MRNRNLFGLCAGGMITNVSLKHLFRRPTECDVHDSVFSDARLMGSDAAKESHSRPVKFGNMSEPTDRYVSQIHSFGGREASATPDPPISVLRRALCTVGPLSSTEPTEGRLGADVFPPFDQSLTARKDILDILPNDLTRLIYLATLRDCNTGGYFHHVLSQQHGVTFADGALRHWHQEVFARMIALPASRYVRQIQTYIRFAGVDRRDLVYVWSRLQAYRTIVPLDASPLETDIFLLNLVTALSILASRFHLAEQDA
jgi:hypothetical protein